MGFLTDRPQWKIAMCNLYNATKTHEAMRQLFLPINDLTNRLKPQMDVFPDYPPPMGRKDANGDRELAIARWWACRRRSSI
jgi:putative SOS response-associated peptidase YedK